MGLYKNTDNGNSQIFIYKIQNQQGLYSTGGMSPRFTKEGKYWVKLQDLNSHLRILKEWKSWSGIRESPFKSVYKDCKIITFKVERYNEELI